MKCFRCNKRVQNGDTLFRVNAKGAVGIWACREHRLEKDQELDQIVEAIEKGEVPPNENP